MYPQAAKGGQCIFSCSRCWTPLFYPPAPPSIPMLVALPVEKFAIQHVALAVMLSHPTFQVPLHFELSDVNVAAGTPKKPAAGADIKASNPDQPYVAALQSDIALDGQLQQYVSAPQGLFPAPLPLHLLADSKVLSHFKLLGRAMAKALQDNRLLDLPLSYVFYRYVCPVSCLI